MVEIIIWLGKVAGSIVAGIFAGHGAVYVFNKIPATWLCDYEEQPSDELKDPYRQRVKSHPWKWMLSGFFVVANLRLAFEDWIFAIAALVACWALLEIAIADGKYKIIPDQFIILTGISAMGFVTKHDQALDLLWGASLGLGIMLFMALVGKLIFKKEVLGFGDVKLFAAIGMILGLKGTVIVLILSTFASCAVFTFGVARKKIKLGDMKPLGPYICGAAIFYIVVVWPFYF